jgi:hypothetical protein
MSSRDIKAKLTQELRSGITTEVQVVYLLAGIRKLMERDKIKETFATLTFHCDWVLHSDLKGPMAQSILASFDTANLSLKDGNLPDLPFELRKDIDNISKMKAFEDELAAVLEHYGLPQLNETRPVDGWTHFLSLYCKVIEDIPLVVTDWNATAKSISKVAVNFEEAREEADLGNHTLYRITWRIEDKNGKYGVIEIYNSYEK